MNSHEQDPPREASLKIVPINPEIAEELGITNKAKSRDDKSCPGHHKRIELDRKLRTTTCRDCGSVLDPFDYLLSWSDDGEARMSALKRIEIQRRIAQAQHDDLERKIKNMRATLKRGGKPQPEAERDHFQMMKWNPPLIESIEPHEQPLL